MFASLVLTALVPSAPVPKAPPAAVEVTAKRVVHPPAVVKVGAQEEIVPIDDGHYVEVTVKNTSKETIRITYHFSLLDCIYAKVTDAKGAEVSERGHHITLYSPSLDSARPKEYELRPGESFSQKVNLKRDWPDGEGKRKPGKYAARIVFESGKLRAESSATFEVEVLK